MMGSMMRRGSFGDGATLDLAFTTMNSTADLTAAGFTFTRSSSATYINASGLLVVAGSNVARFDYDPTNVGTPRGLLIEGSATNLICHSETFASSGGSNNWTTSGATLGSLIYEDPEGTFTAPLLLATASNGTLLNNAGLSSAQRTFSIWLKRVNGTGNVQLTLDNSTWTTVTITPNWARYQITATSTGHVGIRLQTSGDGVHIFGAQLETGSGASSYIPTGTSTANRASDKCISNSISSWYTQGIGTVVVSGRPLLTTPRTFWNFSAGAAVPRIQLYSSVGSDVNAYLENPSGTGANIVFPTGSLTNGTLFKAAWAFQTGSHAACVNGNAVATSSTSSPAVPTSGMTRFSVGHRYDEVNQFNGHIVSIKYWPSRLANADLQAFTT